MRRTIQIHQLKTNWQRNAKQSNETTDMSFQKKKDKY